MRSKSLDFSTFEAMHVPDAHKRTERSHEENQERAYIAASRRTDRSLEARVQSARMASEIHKRRTGKSFRISEQIVLKEEMYEEEDDDLPRSYRILGHNMQSASSEMSQRVEAYLSNKVAMSAILARTNAEWRNNEVNTLFDKMFPHVSYNSRNVLPNNTPPHHPKVQGPAPLSSPQHQHQQQQHLHHNPSQQHCQQYYHPCQQQAYQQAQQQQAQQQQAQQQQAQQQQAQQQQAQQQQYQHHQYPQQQQAQQQQYQQSLPTHVDFEGHEYFGGVGLTNSPNAFKASRQPESPMMDMDPAQSAFTTELPAEAKMMTDVGASLGLEPAFANWDCLDSSFVPRLEQQERVITPGSDSFAAPNFNWDASAMGQPTSMDDAVFQAYIDEKAWGTNA